MRRLLGGMIMSLGGVVAGASEPVAVSATRTPIAATASSRAAGSGVTLERPRVVRGSAPDNAPPLPSGIVPALFSVSSSELKPAPRGVRPADLEEADGPSNFAIERTAFVAAEPIAAPRQAPIPSAMPALSAATEVQYLDGTMMEDEGAADGGERGFYGSAEYLAWWTRSASIPPLLTTSTQPFVFSQRRGLFSGSLNDPNRIVLVGDPVGGEMQHGARVRAGYWFDTCKPIAVEGSYFFLAPRSDNFSTNSNTFPGLFRPFRDSSGFESIQIIAAPGISTGTAMISAPTKLNGWDLNLRCPIWCDSTCAGDVRLDVFGGVRAVRLQDGLYITEIGVNDPNPPPPIVANRAFRVDDRFDTDNRFYGGQIGLLTQYSRGPWSVDLRTAVALGNMRQIVSIFGQNTVVDPGRAPVQAQGGLLALPGLNMGRFTRNRFAVAPEVGLTLGYQVTDQLRVTAGYNFLFLSSVVRPGDQIDRTLNAARIPFFGGTETGLARPAVLFRDTTFWAQGFTLGAEYKY